MNEVEIIVSYENKKKLCFCDFIDVIKEDFLKYIIIKIVVLLIVFILKLLILKKMLIEMKMNFLKVMILFIFSDKNFGINGICTDEFVKDLLDKANKNFNFETL